MKSQKGKEKEKEKEIANKKRLELKPINNEIKTTEQQVMTFENEGNFPELIIQKSNRNKIYNKNK